jgi:hypothetical protein
MFHYNHNIIEQNKIFLKAGKILILFRNYKNNTLSYKECIDLRLILNMFKKRNISPLKNITKLFQCNEEEAMYIWFNEFFPRAFEYLRRTEINIWLTTFNNKIIEESSNRNLIGAKKYHFQSIHEYNTETRYIRNQICSQYPPGLEHPTGNNYESIIYLLKNEQMLDTLSDYDYYNMSFPPINIVRLKDFIP